MRIRSRPLGAHSVHVTFAVLIVALALLGGAVATQGPRFYPDDPIQREPESQDASNVQASDRPLLYEISYNLIVVSRHKPSGMRAQNVNTIDEVPDSSWFTNRIGATHVTVEQIARGPIEGPAPDPSKWVLIREKTSGAHPGFTARDARGDTFFLEFDPHSNPEGATAAVAIATKIFWALGYNQVESFISSFDLQRTEYDPTATLQRPNGARTPFTRDDVDQLLERVARNRDGSYRVIAGRRLPGQIIGEFRYSGMRPDDPNDVIPHEHRRELRALRVFGAWTNLTDLKAGNTLDTVVTENGRSVVKHYLQDVGSTFGMCNGVHEWDLSWEHFLQVDATKKRLLSLGFALSPWQTVDYEEYPSVGKFEGTRFDPLEWRPQTPTTAYMELRADDAFWAAQRVAAFTDEMIRAAVHVGEFSDPAAERHLADVLIQRRDKIKRVFLPAVNPVISPRLDAAGRLSFGNAAVDAGVAKAPALYRASWALFDNATGQTKPLSETSSQSTTIEAPKGLPTSPGSFIAVDIAADSAEYASWKEPVRTHFRRDPSGWTLVGLRRLPDIAPAAGFTGEPLR